MKAAKILMIVNPVSGTLRTRGELFDILRILNGAEIAPTVRFTSGRGHAAVLADEGARSGEFEAVVCAGGDGTFHEVLTGLDRSGVSLPVGYIPAGTTNDLANGIGLSTDLQEAAADIVSALRDGVVTELDCGKFGDGPVFSYIASFGAFTSASYSTPQQAKNNLGYFAYLLQGIGDFFQIKPIHAVCEAGGARYEGDFIFGGVCNTFSIGKIVKLDETSVDMSDGLFEVILVKNPKDFSEFNRLVAAAASSDIESDMFIFFKASHVSFRLPAGTLWTLDGEKAEADGPVDISIKKRAVKLLSKAARGGVRRDIGN